LETKTQQVRLAAEVRRGLKQFIYENGRVEAGVRLAAEVRRGLKHSFSISKLT